MESILIVGGTGCISSAIVEETLHIGIETTVINRGKHKSRIPFGVKTIIADKKDYTTIEKAISNKRYTAIVDFLCYNGNDLKRSFQFYSKYANQYIFISSAQVYNYRKVTVSKEDSIKVDDRWAYSIDKWNAENELRRLAPLTKCNYTIIRPSITYGDTRIPYGITPPYGQHGTIIQRILHSKPIIRWNYGNNKCNMMRVEDFARAFVKLIGNTKAYNEEFNICSENIYSYNDVLNELSKKLGRNIKIVDITTEEYANIVSERKGEIIAGRGTDCISSFAKFKSLFPDFKEEFNLEKGIAKTVDAYYNQNWMDGINWEFDGECDRIAQKHANIKSEFIDYLGSATKEDKRTYKTYLHKGRCDVIVFLYAKRLLNKVKRLFKIP